MSWTDRLRAALSGDVAGVDVDAMLAATAPLDALHQALDDRRLSSRINHVGDEWRVIVEAANLAAPLWLADSLIVLAQGLREAAADGHPDRARAWSAAAHDLAVALLQPLEALVAEASAAAADPNRPTRLTAAVMAGPRGEIAAAPLPAPVAPDYLSGLVLAAERLHGAASQLLGDAEGLLHAETTPAWLTAGSQRVKGDLAAAGARFAMVRTRLNAMLPDPARFRPGVTDAAPATLCMEIWDIVNTALVAGQRLAEPRLLPGAPATDASSRRAAPAEPVGSGPASAAAVRAPAAPPQPPAPKPSAPPSTPRRPIVVEHAHELPDIQTLPTPRRQQSLLESPQRGGEPTDGDHALPDIGGPPAAPPDDTSARQLPSIGGHTRSQDEVTPADLPRIGPEPAP